tara:strand:+ start:121 stop:984 length:864 start_codon:yes stop_codon:yes gene_type:complete
MSSDTITNTEVKEVKESKKGEFFSEFLGFNEIKNFTDIKEQLDEMSLGKREENTLMNECQKFIMTAIKLQTDINAYIQEKTLVSSYDKIISKLEKEKGKKKSKTDAAGDDDSVEKKNTQYAVHKTAKCYEFFNKFMLSQDKSFTPNENNEYSPVEIRNAMNGFVNKEKKENPDKISKDMPDGRTFKIYGSLKDLISDITNIIKEDIKFIEKTIKDMEKLKPAEDSKEAKTIIYMNQWAESKKTYIKVPETLKFTDFMTYSAFCFEERDVIRKASKKPDEKKEKKEKN